jgi:hypothetical protein
MLVHACVECGTFSINRIAADDDPEVVLSVFQLSLGLNQLDFYSQQNITMLGMEDAEVIRVQLFGQVALT